jgi:single-strand DNA-binding protein
MNTTIIAGNVGSDPEVKELANVNLCVFSVAVNEYQGKEKEPLTTWFRVQLWGRDGIHPHIQKGQRITVSGKMRYHEYEKDGQKKSYWTLDVGSPGTDLFLGSGAGGSTGAKTKASAKHSPKAQAQVDEDDLPF